jgi:hypothetical protein
MFFIYQIITLFQIIKTEELKFVFQVHRHGARSPLKGVHKGVDCYGEEWIGRNELTEVGKRSHFLIGVRNRRRFIEKYKLLKKKFDTEEIEIYTTDFNRTIQSVYAQLQGLYPEKTGKRIPNHLINTSLILPPTENYTKFYKEMELKYFYGKRANYSLPNRINVFPFHFFYLPDHHIQLQSRSNCPNLKKFRGDVEKRDDIILFINKLTEKYGNALMKLENTTNKTFLYDYMTTYKYMDSFISDITDGRNLSKLKELIGEENMDDFKKMSFEFLYLDWNGTNYFNTKIAQVTMSYTFRRILRKMNAVINNQTRLKYIIYSMHDNTIGGFEIFNNLAFNTSLEYTYFAENVYLELYLLNETYYVRLISNDVIRLDIPFKEFEKKVKKFLLTDEEIAEFCGWDKGKIENYTQLTRLIIFIVNTLLFLLFIINYVYHMK